MKDWRTIADSIIQANSKITPQGTLCLNAEALSIGIAHALEMAANPVNISEHDPWMHRHATKLADLDIRLHALEERLAGDTRPVLVSDKWLEDLNNKIAQINQRLNHMEGMQRGFADIVTAQAVRLDEQERHMKKVQEIAFKVQAEWTTKNVDKWAKDNLEEKT